MSFQIHALPAAVFAPLFDMSDAARAARNARRVVVDAKPGYPCRVSLADAEIGESVLLVHYEHQPEATPYRASHAVFVREGVEGTRPAPGEVPDVLKSRLLSLRAFNASHEMIAADVMPGEGLADAAEAMFADPAVQYLHIHNAKPGCYAARATRA